jgi:regulator of replication initiation timing
MKDENAAAMIELLIGAMNERIALLEEKTVRLAIKNKQLRDELDAMTRCAQAHDKARTEYLTRLSQIRELVTL